MTQEDLPAGEMKYSFKLYVEAVGYRGDLIVSSTSVNDLVKSLRLLEHAGITQTEKVSSYTTLSNDAPPVCRYHGPMKPSKKPGAFFCPKKLADGSYCQEQASV